MILTPKPLTVDAFASYGDVIDTQTAENSFEINYGLTTRFHDMANIDVSDHNGVAGFSIFTAQPSVLPQKVKVMEYHPFGSQLFYPTCEIPFLVLVAPPSESLQVDKLELFISNGKQGVNYNKGTWHHYLLPLGDSISDFIVVDRIANDNNCIETQIEEEIILALT